MKRLTTCLLGVLLLTPTLVSGAAWSTEDQPWNVEEAVTDSPGAIKDFQVAVSQDGRVGIVYYFAGAKKKLYLYFSERSAAGEWMDSPELIFTGRNLGNALAFQFTYAPDTDLPTIAHLLYGGKNLYFSQRDASGWFTETAASNAFGREEEIGLAFGPGPEFAPWLLYNTSQLDLTAAQRVGSSWIPETVLGERARWKSIAVDPWGQPAVAFRIDADGDGWLDDVQFSYRLGGAWSTPESFGAWSGSVFFGLDGLPRMLYEADEYGIARRVGGASPYWEMQDIVWPNGESPSVDMGISSPVYASTGEILASLAGPWSVHLTRRGASWGDPWTFEMAVEAELEGREHFEGRIGIDSFDLPYVALMDTSDESRIFLATPRPCGTGCNDGIVCTSDECVDGHCRFSTPDPIMGDIECMEGTICTHPGLCEIDGRCNVEPLPDGTDCGQGLECREGECVDADSSECVAAGGFCTSGADCCSGLCHPKKHECK